MALFDDTRSAWGARPAKGTPTYVAPARRTEFMNHWNGGPTGLSASSSHSRCLAVVKADQTFHMDGRGWNDIGYNGLVCPHARAIECRGIDYAGAHCPDHNTSAYGWQFAIGKGETATPAMFDRMARALADCQARSGHTLRLMGHRDGFNTECPGDQIEAWVKAGMPGAQEDIMATLDDDDIARIAKAVWTYDGLVPGRSVWGELVTGTNRAQTSVDGIKALASTLPADAAKAVLDALDKSYDAKVELTPKEN